MEGHVAHRPVLLEPVKRLLLPALAGGGKLLVDCTVGAGGHTEALLGACPPDTRALCIDVDEANLLLARERLSDFSPRVRFFQANFAQLGEVLTEAQEPAAEALLADLGVASTQLDDPARGLSFLVDGPLDMRLDRRIERTAADLVNDLPERELADLIYRYGEERYSRRIARAIVSARRQRRIERTLELAALVAGAIPRPAKAARRGVHPATRTFQALRIAVNDEMANLERLLESLPAAMAPAGRAAIISFQSLEDRRVKQAFAALAGGGEFELLTRKPLAAGPDEIEANPRSRSAKLRAIQRLPQKKDAD